MGTDTQQRQRGEAWRKNSGRWGSQGWDGNPPAMPAPPPEAQDSLSRKSSLVNTEQPRNSISNQPPWLEEKAGTSGNTANSFRKPKSADGAEKKIPLVTDKNTYKIQTPDYIKDWIDPLTLEEKKPKRYCDDWEDEAPQKVSPFGAKLKATKKDLSKPFDSFKDDIPKTPEPPKFEKPQLKPVVKTEPIKEKETLILPELKKPDLSNEKSSPAKSPGPPPPPPPPPPPISGPPPPPPPPSKKPLTEKEMKMRKARLNFVDKIKKASRIRPDWQTVMKDIEGGIKLRKVDSCDKMDRSNPILPSSREKEGKFFYESEKPTLQNELLHEIHRGVKLRHVRTNDRSKPDFNRLGLRKLRRQLTTEEKKNLDPDNPETLPSSSDEEEDIDRMRDDIAATKSQLTDEIKRNKKMETENKILKIDIESLQAEIKRMKRKLKEAGIHEAKPLSNGEANALGPKLSKSMSRLRMMEDEVNFSELDVIEEDIKILNDEVEAQKKRADKAEQKCEELKLKLQVANSSSEEWETRSIYFEKKFKHVQKDLGIELPDINCVGVQCDSSDLGPLKAESTGGILAKKSASRKAMTTSFARMESFKEEDSDEDSSSSSDESTISDRTGDEEEEEEEQKEEEEVIEEINDEPQDNEMTAASKQERNFIMMKNKLQHMKDKERNTRKERNALRDKVLKIYKDMRTERQEYLKIKGELQELSDQVREGLEDIDEEEEGEDEDSDMEERSHEEPQLPVKFRSSQAAINTQAEEEESSDDDIVDFTGLEDPNWSDSEGELSDSGGPANDGMDQLKKLEYRVKTREERAARLKKQTYKLKAQIENSEDMLEEEKWRHGRLESELHTLLSDI